MKTCYSEDKDHHDIGVDEAGRGPLFGRVYSAAVILPKENFHHEWMKDSKLIKSEKKMNELASYIKENAINWSIHYATESEIDDLNILQATQKCMKECIQDILDSPKSSTLKINLLIDGNYFKPGNLMLKYRQLKEIACIKGGDHSYSSIAAASILAKQARDDYIKILCEENPDLIQKYNLAKNKGYGAKAHLDGINEHGITIWHRKSFAPCKNKKSI